MHRRCSLLDEPRVPKVRLAASFQTSWAKAEHRQPRCGPWIPSCTHEYPVPARLPCCSHVGVKIAKLNHSLSLWQGPMRTSVPKILASSSIFLLSTSMRLCQLQPKCDKTSQLHNSCFDIRAFLFESWLGSQKLSSSGESRRKRKPADWRVAPAEKCQRPSGWVPVFLRDPAAVC